MERRKYIYSLIFPILTVITGTVWALNDFIIPALLVVTGGLVSIFLAINFKNDTSKHLKLRIIFFFISLITFAIPFILFNNLRSPTILNILLIWLIIAPFITFVTELIILIRQRLFSDIITTVTILLSDPLTHNLVILIYALVAWWIHGV